MRYPCFARKSNPSIDPPIIRKNLSYLQSQVRDLLADWVDPDDMCKGIIAREYLPSGKVMALDLGEKASDTHTKRSTLPGVELPGMHFEQPLSQPQRNMGLIFWHWQQSEKQHQALLAN